MALSDRSRWTLSVSELNEYVRRSLAADPMLRSVRLRGEISGLKRHSSGHMYFTLKDEGARVAAVMFRQQAMGLDFRPAEGQQVVAEGSVSLYAAAGQYQLYVERMEPEGQGDLFRRFEQLKDRLLREGLFDPSLKKPLPLLPRGIGIVTSSTGAVVHDICTVTWRRNPAMPLYLCPVKVQGEGAAKEIAAAIRRLDRMPEAEVLIVGRGGGSMEDLWPFNEEIVARAIAACQTPVVSAVGHETDFTIADFAADMRAPTPSAAAELCAQPREALLDEIDQQAERMERCLTLAFSDAETRLKQAETRLKAREPEQLLSRYGLRLENVRQRLESAVSQRMQQTEARLRHAEARLRSSGPQETLRRGYAVALKDGRLLKSAANAAAGDPVRLMLQDGSLLTRVEAVETSVESMERTGTACPQEP